VLCRVDIDLFNRGIVEKPLEWTGAENLGNHEIHEVNPFTVAERRLARLSTDPIDPAKLLANPVSNEQLLASTIVDQGWPIR
jgi:hypothetical protein